MIFHALSSIGMTDRRDWRIKARSSSRPSYLICCNVTGVITGIRALKETMPKRFDA